MILLKLGGSLLQIIPFLNVGGIKKVFQDVGMSTEVKD